ncbi:hypothetical protein AGLY_006996 [Aphis glycines]|uniref:Uncharacterized protein n=1 Tax=Aphis glycines TaxID=307491 RepID=A0A6G0TPF6_APHGL|nr:hypothetical protein AGLY_006996 [Aphis glycines]
MIIISDFNNTCLNNITRRPVTALSMIGCLFYFQANFLFKFYCLMRSVILLYKKIIKKFNNIIRILELLTTIHPLSALFIQNCEKKWKKDIVLSQNRNINNRTRMSRTHTTQRIPYHFCNLVSAVILQTFIGNVKHCVDSLITTETNNNKYSNQNNQSQIDSVVFLVSAVVDNP